MLKPYELLESVLDEIEKGLKEEINTEALASHFSLSASHLRRLFLFAFGQSMGAYIRARKLAASINDLLQTKTNVLDIALDYGFGYEQSYIRTFKREFGCTPGELRKDGRIVKIKPPLHLFDENKLGDSAFFGPEFVVVPQFHVVGKRHRIPHDDSLNMAPAVGKYFWESERGQIINTVNPNTYIGLTRDKNNKEGYSEYTTSVQVSDLSSIPEGYSGDTFDTSLCARFRYIGQHHYYDINREAASMMYQAIGKFADDKQAKYTLSVDKIYFERIDSGLYDGNYCQMEWFTPVTEKFA